MSKLIGDRLTDDFLDAFGGRNLAGQVGLAYLLISTDEDNTPRPCMLSAGEVLVPNDRTIRVGLWPGTRTAKNLSRGERVLFCYVAARTVLYAKGRSVRLSRSDHPKLEGFDIKVDTVESDIHPGMPVKETIAFDIEGIDLNRILEQWARQTEALRDL